MSESIEGSMFSDTWFYHDSKRAVPYGIPSLGTALFRYSNLI
ncbi:hypothetical protein HMPREF1989_00403 [Porphyromonas gingivalis F0566]|nr:hypothetical protein HMPREF1989_00403 [Porphyromonas gingivalis F0566]